VTTPRVARIVALDVHYQDDTAHVACVGFHFWEDDTPDFTWDLFVQGVAPYEPGSFYKRELPCLTKILDGLPELPVAVIVDGYVDTSPDHPGLGRRLHDHYQGRLAVVIGVAKTHFAGTDATPVLRGTSRTPLFVTAAGLEQGEAATLIRNMHGPHRLPTMLKLVDTLSRSKG
jgi:deoxyribonuclease V